MAKKNKQPQIQELNLENEDMANDLEVIDEAPPIEQPKKVEFDAWYAARSASIPAIHKKEIIKADFKGRKVPMIASMEDFDKALEKYGVKLV